MYEALRQRCSRLAASACALFALVKQANRLQLRTCATLLQLIETRAKIDELRNQQAITSLPPPFTPRILRRFTTSLAPPCHSSRRVPTGAGVFANAPLLQMLCSARGSSVLKASRRLLRSLVLKASRRLLRPPRLVSSYFRAYDAHARTCNDRVGVLAWSRG